MATSNTTQLLLTGTHMLGLLYTTISFPHTAMDHPPQLLDRNVRLLKTETLGSGSYGVVCKAMWGQRLCAAKLLHLIFFQSNDPGMMTTRRKFEQECRFLSEMKHLNIVEYLGTSHDPDSGLLVLLMELGDESLTHFLERSQQQPLAYHIEVDLCHDIAQALSYIHSREIIHRDLSGNNVLLIAGKAKITDFGMSKLLDANRRMTPLTMCPGTLAYMPPEALGDPPVYTKKIDCFSFGVLQIQIMTRQFPDPGPAMQVVEDSRSPTGTVKMPVLDSERRKSHIDLIDPTHALLPTALSCLSYLEKDRPSAQDLCQQLATFKETPRYTHSMQQAQLRELQEQNEVQTQQIRQQLQTLAQELRTQEQQLRDSQSHTHTLQQELRDSQRRLDTLQQELQDRQRRMDTPQQELQDSQRRLDTLQQELRAKHQQLQDSQRHKHTLQQELQNRQRRMDALQQELQDRQRRMDALQQELRAKDQQLLDSQRCTHTLQQELQDSQRCTHTLQQELQDSQRCMDTLQQELQDSQRHTHTLQQELQDSHRCTHTLQQELQDRQQQIQQLTHQVEEKQHTIDDRETQLRQLNGQLQANEQVTVEFQRNLLQHEQTNSELQETVGQLRRDLKQAVEEKQAGERQLQELTQRLQVMEVGVQEKSITRPRQELQQAQPVEHAAVGQQRQLQKPKMQQLQQMKRTATPPQKALVQQKTIRDMKWQKESKVPEVMWRGSAASDSNMAYFNGRFTTRVYSYNSDTQKWRQLPDTPHTNTTLVVVQHILTMVGGYVSGKFTNSLLSLMEEGGATKWLPHFLLSLMGEGWAMKWLPHYPAMPTARSHTAAVCSGHSLIVAGGEGDRYSNKLATVEVLDIDTKQWSTACSLPHPFSLATISICRERLYLMGGLDETDVTHSVLTCSVPELLQSQTEKLRTEPEPDRQTTKWRRIADAPSSLSSCATLCGQLVAVGGWKDDKDTAAIFVYKETTDSWEAMGDMPTARCLALVAILNGKLMAVGGRVRGWRGFGTRTDVVEILC